MSIKRNVLLIMGGLALAIPLFPFLFRATVWPSGDFDGHLATIELYRSALAQGVWWPYDYHAGLGNDAVPFYGWYFELLIGFVALILSWILSPQVASTVAGVSMAVAALVVFPLIFAEALQLENSSWCLPAILLAGLFACLPSDTFTPNGASMVFDFGMLTGFVGLILLVWLTVLLHRYETESFHEFKATIPLVIAMIIGTHPLSAFVAGILAGLSGVVILYTRCTVKCWGLVQFFILAFLLSAPCVHALFATHSQHNSFVDDAAPTGLSIIGAIFSLHMPWKLPLAFMLAALLLASLRDYRSLFFRGGVLFSALPLSGVFPLIWPSVHAYRLLPFGSILLLISGMRGITVWFDRRPQWIPLVQPLFGAGAIYCLLLWCLPRMLNSSAIQMHHDFLASFGAVYQRSFVRVLIADEENYKAPFFKHGVELAAHLYDFESANSFHWLKGTENLAPLSAAISSLGGQVWYPRFVYEHSPITKDQALSILRYYGINEVYLPEDRTVHPSVLGHITIDPLETSKKVTPLEGLVLLERREADEGFTRHYEALARMSLSPSTFKVGYIHTLSSRTTPLVIARMSSLSQEIPEVTTPLPHAEPRITQRSFTSFRIEGLVPERPYLLKYSYSRYWQWDNADSVEELSGMTVLVPHTSEISGTFSRFWGQGFYISYLVALITAVTLTLYARFPGRS